MLCQNLLHPHTYLSLGATPAKKASTSITWDVSRSYQSSDIERNTKVKTRPASLIAKELYPTIVILCRTNVKPIP